MEEHYGYLMTDEQADKLTDILTENILERYNNDEYYDPDLIEEFAENNNLKKGDLKND